MKVLDVNVVRNEYGSQVQILAEAVCVSLSADTRRKSLNSIILPA